MYLTRLIENNPRFLETVIDYHQRGLIPANSWVVDLDTIVDNADKLAAVARGLGLTTYLMSKQHNRNPYINKLALSRGLNKLVAVDIQGVIAARRYKLPLGHAGHLNQIPRRDIPLLLSLNPDIITIYNREHGFWINQAAEREGRIQNLMLRVYEPGDLCFAGQEGGFRLRELPGLVEALKPLKHIRISGVTAFPCLSYNETPEEPVITTPNTDTLQQGAQILRDMGLTITQLNMPGNTACRTMPLLKDRGATHVEPGNSLLGTTPDNAFRSDTPEKTAFAYLSEISHTYGGKAYAYGGGAYHTNYSKSISALVGTSFPEARRNRISYDHSIVQDIDYHMTLQPQKDRPCRVGDSVVLAYRTQMHMTRSYVVLLSGISGRKKRERHYIFDNANNAFDGDYNPVYPEEVLKDIEKLIESYG